MAQPVAFLYDFCVFCTQFYNVVHTHANPERESKCERDIFFQGFFLSYCITVNVSGVE